MLTLWKLGQPPWVAVTAIACAAIVSVGLGAVFLDPSLSPRRMAGLADSAVTSNAFHDSSPRRVGLPHSPRLALGRVAAIQGLGDSVTAAAGCGCTSFVSLLAQQLSTSSYPVLSLNNGKDGLTSKELLDLARAQGTRASPDRVTVVTIGANDFDSSVLSTPNCTAPTFVCYRAELAAFSSHLGALLDQLAPTGQAHGPVLVTNYWNVFLAGDVGEAQGPEYVTDSDALTRQVNDVINTVTQGHGDTLVDLYRPFADHSDADENTLLAPDGDHPSTQGHELIASLLRAALSKETS